MQRFWFRMIAQILEWPHPIIDQDWDSSRHQWREITPLACKELRTSEPLREDQMNAFMQVEPVDFLANGDGLYVCGKYKNGGYFVRLLPGSDWCKRDYLLGPPVSALF